MATIVDYTRRRPTFLRYGSHYLTTQYRSLAASCSVQMTNVTTLKVCSNGIVCFSRNQVPSRSGDITKTVNLTSLSFNKNGEIKIPSDNFWMIPFDSRFAPIALGGGTTSIIQCFCTRCNDDTQRGGHCIYRTVGNDSYCSPDTDGCDGICTQNTVGQGVSGPFNFTDGCILIKAIQVINMDVQYKNELVSNLIPL